MSFIQFGCNSKIRVLISCQIIPIQKLYPPPHNHIVIVVDLFYAFMISIMPWLEIRICMQKIQNQTNSLTNTKTKMHENG